jgi:hypothetical protein
VSHAVRILPVADFPLVSFDDRHISSHGTCGDVKPTQSSLDTMWSLGPPVGPNNKQACGVPVALRPTCETCIFDADNNCGQTHFGARDDVARKDHRYNHPDRLDIPVIALTVYDA